MAGERYRMLRSYGSLLSPEEIGGDQQNGEPLSWEIKEQMNELSTGPGKKF